MANLIRRRNPTEESLAPELGRWDPSRIMRSLMGWDPFHAFERGWEGRRGGVEMFLPDVEVKESHDGYHFKVDLPGVKEEDLEVTLTGNRLMISGKRVEEEHHEDETFHAFERAYGTFQRSFTLPEGADVDAAKADLSNGVLLLTIPKKPEIKPKKLAFGAGKEKKPIKA
jgi:HSP20 family protein